MAVLKRVVRTALTHRRLPFAAALLAMLFVLPSLKVGWVTEDHLHGIQIRGSERFGELFGSSWSVFRFYDGDPERTGRMMDLGLLPWWTMKEMKEQFWRPLTVLTHWIDYRLWPTSPMLMHVQSIVWYGVLAVLAAFLYRRMMGVTVAAGLAAVLYAVDDTHGTPVGFLANRNALLAVSFGIAVLIAHDRWRRHGWRMGVVVGPLLLAVSLLSAEAGIATCAYLAAYALFVERGAWRRRAAALTPYVAVVVVWRAVWTYLGYGVSQMGLYLDPLTEPVRYAAAALERVPLLLLSQLGLPPSDVTLLLDARGIFGLWIGALIFLGLLGVLFWPLLRRDRLARFWALGTVLSLLPVCATFPMDRLLLFAGVGAMGLLARFFVFVSDRLAGRAGGASWRLVAGVATPVLVVIHLVLAPIMLLPRSESPMGPTRFFGQPAFGEALDASVEKQDVIIVNPPSAFHVTYLPLLRELNGQPVPRHTRILAPGLTPIEMRRPDARTLVIRPENGYLAYRLDQLFRDLHRPMALGERVALTGMTVEVAELTSDGRPAEAVFRFDVPLEDASLVWFAWRDGSFAPFTPPAVGADLVLRPCNGRPLTTVFMAHLPSTD